MGSASSESLRCHAAPPPYSKSVTLLTDLPTLSCSVTDWTMILLNQSLTGSGADWPGRYHFTGTQAIVLPSSEDGM